MQFHCRSFFDTDLRPATIVMLYLLPFINVRLRPKLLAELKPGTRIVSNYFEMGDWQPDIRADVHHRVLWQWVVPVNVAGTWRCEFNGLPAVSEAGEATLDDDRPRPRRRIVLRLKQRFQSVSGIAQLGRRNLQILNGRLFADQLTFKVRDPATDPKVAPPTIRLSCRLEGNFLRGTWQADATGAGPTAAWGGVRIDLRGLSVQSAQASR